MLSRSEKRSALSCSPPPDSSALCGIQPASFQAEQVKLPPFWRGVPPTRSATIPRGRRARLPLILGESGAGRRTLLSRLAAWTSNEGRSTDDAGQGLNAVQLDAPTQLLLVIDWKSGVGADTLSRLRQLGLPSKLELTLVINKLDLAGFDYGVFRDACAQAVLALAGIQLVPAAIIPICARHGDMVERAGEHIDWYEGPSLLDIIRA